MFKGLIKTIARHYEGKAIGNATGMYVRYGANILTRPESAITFAAKNIHSAVRVFKRYTIEFHLSGRWLSVSPITRFGLALGVNIFSL